MRVKNILVPADFTPCSINMLEHVGHIADEFEAKVLILHGLSEVIESQEAMADYKEKMLEHMLKIVNDTPSLANSTVDIKIDEQIIEESLPKAVKDHNVDLIIMGAKRNDNILTELVYSTTFKAIQENNCPVLAIPENVKYKPYERIALASDFKKLNHTSSLDIILDFCYAFQSKLNIFHIEDGKSKSMDKKFLEVMQLEDYFSNVDYSIHELEGESPEEGVISFVKDHHIDLLAIMPRDYSYVKGLVHKSFTNEVIKHLQVPVLAFHS